MTDRTLPLPLSAVNPEERIIAGRYRLAAPIARGGMATVFEAEQLGSGQRFAVKMVSSEVADAARVADRLRREAYAATLDHPNIVKIYDLVTEDGALYLVMELVRGRALGELLEAGAIAPRRTLVIARQVLDALAHAHARRIVHRDLKPDNIMIARVGESGSEHEHAKLLDFGLLKVLGDASGTSDNKLTRTGMVAGTPTYLAPEQVLGRPLDARIDLYSLGVVLFEMLAGRPPFRSPDAQTLMRMHVSAPVPTLASVVPGRAWCTSAVEALVARALAKQPESRFRDAGEMTHALDEAFVSLDHLPPES